MENQGYDSEIKLKAVKKVDEGGVGPHHDPSEIVVESIDPATKNNLTVKYVEKSHPTGNRCCMVLFLAITLSLAVIAGAMCNYFLSHQDPPMPEPTPCPTVGTQDAGASVRSAGRSKSRSLADMKPMQGVPIPVAIHDKKPPKSVCLTKGCVKAAGRIIENMDESVNPCDNFYEYSCGGWLKNNPIPAEKSRYGILDQIIDRNSLILKRVLEKSADSVESSAERKSLRLYQACMDIERRDEIGVAPLVEIINSLGGWNPTTTDLTATVARIVRNYTTEPLFDLSVGVDDYNSTVNRLMVDQPQMVLPDRSFYLRNETDPVVIGYLQFMRTLLGELGLEESTLTDVMSSVFQFEVKIAEIVAPNSERQNILQIYNKVTVSELQALSPQFDWLTILRSLASPYAIDADDEILLYSIEYIKSLSTLIENSDPKVVHNFMLWHLAASFVQVTNSRMKEAYVKLYNTVTGARTGQEQWKDCANIVSNKFSMAVGALFVREAFGPEGKQEVSEIVAHIKTAFKESIRYNGWMSEETRQVAIEKANAMDGKIGYPDYILDPEELDKEFEEVEVDQSNFLQSMVNQARFSLRKSIGKLSKPHDKDEWRAPPQIMNALYRPSTNSMVMLAAILQRPIFDSENLKALNYAGIGFVVAHELTHGFDTHGRLYNQDGNIAPWWSEESTRKFEERTRCVVDQYSEYEVEGTGMKINGNMTKAENIADLGAIKHAFNAYRTQVMESGEEEELPGLEKTNDQTFFLAYAQNWCTNRRTESSKLQLITDSHSPAAYRVIGTLSQFDEFSRAFSCSVGSNMNPEQKCSVF